MIIKFCHVIILISIRQVHQAAQQHQITNGPAAIAVAGPSTAGKTSPVPELRYPCPGMTITPVPTPLVLPFHSTVLNTQLSEFPPMVLSVLPVHPRSLIIKNYLEQTPQKQCWHLSGMI